MAHKAISFLGYTPPDRPYRETTYQFAGQTCTTPFMTEATARFFQDELDLLLVLVTPEAKQQNLAALRNRLPHPKRLKPVDIPSSQDTASLWAMFHAIAGEIEPGDHITFDITNGFRSLPLLALLAASFVRVVRGAHVERMIYGAYDATSGSVTPVFDLSPLLALLDWTTATDAFLKYGRADDLVDRMRQGQGAATNSLADTLATLTAGLQVSRPTEVQRAAACLGDQVKAVRSDPATPAPIGLLLDRISAEYTPLGHVEPTAPVHAREVLQGQVEIVQWYVGKGLYVQAITLAREWLVSWVVARAGGDLFAKADREYAEAAINGFPSVRMHERGRKVEVAVPAAMLAAADHQPLKLIWRATRDLRNDLGHTGMRPDPRLATEVHSQVERACGGLAGLLAEE
ncbi:MAG: TIGR02221 family CRISPR-associated protein [Candidatus Viridilinea halotolerans]|uniref:TIGR02221 family CRISPR-associated protein n=1 Tax=Candidatus Viridilinea halotolerans TaxID=2491704 RepID=A0A426TYA9_9CHLR|nr:MAG: TIGR02221 family CRISPR-associated protein [Candidatus Viridilinea halotolerans]